MPFAESPTSTATPLVAGVEMAIEDGSQRDTRHQTTTYTESPFPTFEGW